MTEILEQENLDALLVSSDENRFYLSGFTGSAGYFLITRTASQLVADGRYWNQVEEQCPDLGLVRFKLETHGNIGRAALTWLHQLGGIERVGIEGRNLTVSDYGILQKESQTLWNRDVLVVADGLPERLRECKDAEELARLQKAADTADEALREALKSFRKGVRENEFCAELEFQLQKHGARKPSFDSIVASGPNGARPHATISDRVIGEGELITLDFGSYCNSYCSDMTRTIWLGDLPELEQTVYRTVRAAHAAAIAAVRPGVLTRELDAVARNLITEAGFGEAFSHSLGHGVGLQVHEMPYLRSTTETVLEPGMVITIEPGIYLAGKTGCRVEDTVVVTADGGYSLNHTPYQELGQQHPLDAFA
jgi:Xaa-Pro aminopeptidase